MNDNERKRTIDVGAQEGSVGMELGQYALVSTGDTALPFIIGGIVVVALIVLVVAFVVMKRKR